MVQIKWAKTFLDSDSKCNILVNGVPCATKLKPKSYTVKTHIKALHKEEFTTITGQLLTTGADALTELASMFGTSSAAISLLKNPHFKVNTLIKQR